MIRHPTVSVQRERNDHVDVTRALDTFMPVRAG